MVIVTWAHYLHITDTLEMVQSLNMWLGQIETANSNALAEGDRGGKRPSAELGLAVPAISTRYWSAG